MFHVWLHARHSALKFVAGIGIIPTGHKDKEKYIMQVSVTRKMTHLNQLNTTGLRYGFYSSQNVIMLLIFLYLEDG